MTTAQRLATHPLFRWQAGMLNSHNDPAFRLRTFIAPARTIENLLDPADLANAVDEYGDSTWTLDPSDVPDLADPATAGCLLAALFALRPDTTVGIDPAGEFTVRTNCISWQAETLGEAVGLALLAVWR